MDEVPPERSSARAYALAAAGLCALVLLYFGPHALAGRCLAEGEGVTYYLPMRELVASCWRQRCWPLWNPYVYGGMPLLAALQAGVFYPLNLLYLVLTPVAAMNTVLILDHMIAAVGALLLAREFRVSAWAAAAAGAVFTFSGFMVAHMGHASIVDAAAWLPWLCLVTCMWWRSGGRRWLALGAILWSIQFFAGHPQIVLYSAILVGMLIVSLPIGAMRAGWTPARRQVYHAVDTGDKPRCSLARVGGFGVIALLAAMLSAVQLLPSLAITDRTWRSLDTSSGLYRNYRLGGAYTPLLWVPYLYGTQSRTPLHWEWWGDWNFVEEAGYVGLLPWMLLPAAALLPGGRARSGRTWALIAGAHLLLAWNVATPLGKWLFHVPIYSSFEAAARHLLGLDLALAMCAGIGLDGLTGAPLASRRWRLRCARWGAAAVCLLVLAIAFGALWGYEYGVLDLRYRLGALASRPAVAARPVLLATWVFLVPLTVTVASASVLVRLARRGGSTVRAAVLAVLVLDVCGAAYLCAWRWYDTGDGIIRPPPAAVTELLSKEGTGGPNARYLVFGPHGDDYWLNGHANQRYGWHALNGYDPLEYLDYRRMLHGLDQDGKVSDELLLAGPVLDLWACRYVLVREDLPGWAPPAVLGSSRYRLIGTHGGARVYENLTALPRARLVDRAVSVPDKAAAMDCITTGNLPDGRAYDPAIVTLVCAGDSKLMSPATATERRGAPGQVEWVSYQPNELVLRARVDRDCTLVLAETYAAGWQASIDARPAPIVRADYLLRAVPVPAGTHTVELRYRPVAFTIGFWISAAGAVLVLALLVLPRRGQALPAPSASEGSAGAREEPVACAPGW